MFQKKCERPNGFFSHHIIIVTEGSGKILCNGIKEEVNKGDIFFIEKNVPHTYYSSKNIFSTIWVTFDGNGIPDILKYYDINSLYVLKNTDTKDLTNQLLYLNAKASGNINEAELSNSLYSLIINLFSTKLNVGINRKFEKCIKYINENYSECILLDTLAKISNMNKYTFCREFKSTFSITPFEYVLRIRIQH